MSAQTPSVLSMNSNDLFREAHRLGHVTERPANCPGCGVLRGQGYRHHHNCMTQLGGQVAS